MPIISGLLVEVRRIRTWIVQPLPNYEKRSLYALRIQDLHHLLSQLRYTIVDSKRDTVRPRASEMQRPRRLLLWDSKSRDSAKRELQKLHKVESSCRIGVTKRSERKAQGLAFLDVEVCQRDI